MGVKGFVGSVRSFVRATRSSAFVEDVKADPGGGGLVTLEHLGPPGDDSPPLPTDSVGAFPVTGTGRFVAGGYADPLNEGVADPGEVRRVARDSVGAIVATFYMEADGTVTLSNDNGSVSLLPSGVVNINGATIDTNGNIVSPGEVTASGVTLTGHTHPQANDSAGNTEQDTGAGTG